VKCLAFEKRLERYLAGMLDQADRQAAENHARRCPACRALVQALQPDSWEYGPGEDFAKTVLARTTGPACRRCRSMLSDFLADTLRDVDRSLITSHLKSCKFCNELCQVVVETLDVLPRMREMRTDPAFAREVTAATREYCRKRNDFVLSILGFFEKLLARPRFGWEAAYLITMLMFALFGTPLSPARDAGSRLIASLQGESGLAVRASKSLREHYSNLGLVWEASNRARQSVSRAAEASSEQAAELLDKGRRCLERTETRVRSAGGAVRLRLEKFIQAAESKRQVFREP